MYCQRTGLFQPEQLKAEWNINMAYNMFRIAAILQGIAKRVEMGTAASAQAVASAAGAKPLAQMAWKFAQASTPL
jgi:aminoglycoside phosphotransferase (APT) family kinase protein